MDLKDIKLEYYQKELKQESLSNDPITEIKKWLDDVIDKGVSYPNNAMLATIGRDDTPNLRVVLVKDISDEGITFFTCYDSKKSQDIANNSQVALTFYWKEIDRQIRIKAFAKKTSKDISQKYFDTRSLESRISAVASPQSQKISREELVKRVSDLEGPDHKITCPDNWGGFLLEVQECEFWQGRPNRLHDRFLYEKDEKNDGSWIISRLAP